MKSKTLLIALVAVALALVAGVGCYNKLVSMEEGVESQWAQVENVYQRRADLIPNLVETVKGYAAHESSTLKEVVDARSKALSVTIDAGELTDENLEKFQKSQGDVEKALGKLLAITENYPDLKANQNFLELQAQLEGTENRIATERRAFNETAKTFNSYLRKFPQNIIAGMFGFEKKGYFKAAEGAENAPQVKF